MLGFIPGFEPAVATAQVGSVATKTIIGEENYSDVRSNILWASGLQAGFIPLTPMLPMQIAMFIILIIILIRWDVSAGKAVLSAYIIQALLAAVVWHYAAGKFIEWGLGI